MSATRTTNRPSDPGLGVELALVSVHVAVALGFARLFDTGAFVRPLLGFVLGAHALAIATRRARIPGPIVVGLAFGGGILAATWLLFPDTTAWGLPTGATWDAAAAALREARELYPEVIAPTEAVPGFLLAAGLALWIAAWFADWTAHRLRAGVEAVAPAAAVFTFCAVLGSGRFEVASAVAFAATALGFLALQRAEALGHDQSWSPDQRPVARSARQGAAVLAVAAVLGGALVGPTLPGASSAPALDWRGQGAGDRSRVTVSPMVELRRRLVDQSDVQVFRVTSAERAYWRLTSLDRFDGEIWSSNGEFRPAEADLPTEAPNEAIGDRITQAVEIDALAAIWVPAAFEAVSVRSSDEPLRWDPDSSTLIVDSGTPTSDGLTYTVVSRAPSFDPNRLATSGTDDPPSYEERYESLPADFPDEASDLARRVTAGADNRYEQAMALQDHFRTEYEYSTSVPAGHGDDALVDFLTSQVGYCEQFAGAYAAMARSLGIPARVAVGFTPGEQDPRAPEVFVVRGRHAHAWPEVYFPRIGWVPFEPTPGRGIPGGEAYTGVAADQDDTPSTSQPEINTTAAPSSSAPDPDRTTVPADDRQRPSQTSTGAGDDDTGDGSGRPLLPLVLIAAATTAAVVVVRRRRGRQAGAALALGPADRAWAEVRRHLEADGLEPDPAETPAELARRASAAHAEVAPELRRLAELVGAERWAADPLGADEEAEVERCRAAIVAQLEAPARPPVPVGG